MKLYRGHVNNPTKFGLRRVIKVNLMTDWLKMGKKEYNLETVTLTNVVCIVKI